MKDRFQIPGSVQPPLMSIVEQECSQRVRPASSAPEFRSQRSLGSEGIIPLILLRLRDRNMGKNSMTLSSITSLCSEGSSAVEVKAIWKIETLKKSLLQNWTRELRAPHLSNADNYL